MTRNEIISIIRSTFRAHARRNERLVSRDELREWWNDALRRYGVVLPAALAEAAEESICNSFIGGQCFTHEENEEAVRNSFSALGLPEAMVEEMVAYNVGYIFLYEDAITDAFGNGDVSVNRVVDTTLCLLFHERRHSYQPYREMVEQCRAAANYANNAAAHDSVICEQDANAWSAWQVSYLRTGSVEARIFPRLQDESQTRLWVFMGE